MEGFFNSKKSLEGKVVSRSPARVRGLLCHQSAKGYPALVPGEGWVRGEFLELEGFETLIALCDRVENYRGPGCPGNEYERRVSTVELEGSGEKAAAWIYWYARDDLDKPENPAVPLPEGDWAAYIRG
jgi:gamma-glutamylcyclotransferase (GGCT)/AIG2-like uncharacterized protein YtfP